MQSTYYLSRATATHRKNWGNWRKNASTRRARGGFGGLPWPCGECRGARRLKPGGRLLPDASGLDPAVQQPRSLGTAGRARRRPPLPAFGGAAGGRVGLDREHLRGALFAGGFAAAAAPPGLPACLPPPAGASQCCPGCGTKVPKWLSERMRCCGTCGLELSCDLNTAWNVLERALCAGGWELSCCSPGMLHQGWKTLPARQSQGAGPYTAAAVLVAVNGRIWSSN